MSKDFWVSMDPNIFPPSVVAEANLQVVEMRRIFRAGDFGRAIAANAVTGEVAITTAEPSVDTAPTA